MTKHQGNIIGTNIKQLRIASGETQFQTASNLHISRSCLANYESGARIPQEDVLYALSKHFKVNVDVLRQECV